MIFAELLCTGVSAFKFAVPRTGFNLNPSRLATFPLPAAVPPLAVVADDGPACIVMLDAPSLIRWTVWPINALS